MLQNKGCLKHPQTHVLLSGSFESPPLTKTRHTHRLFLSHGKGSPTFFIMSISRSNWSLLYVLEGQCIPLRTLCTLSSLDAFSKFLCSTDFVFCRIRFGESFNSCLGNLSRGHRDLFILASIVCSCNTERRAVTIFWTWLACKNMSSLLESDQPSCYSLGFISGEPGKAFSALVSSPRFLGRT